MFSAKKFLKPSWKKVMWFFLVFFVAQLYIDVVIELVPTRILQQFVNFILNPASVIFEQQIADKGMFVIPIVKTLNVMWNYVLATILAKEISKDKD